MFNLNSLVRDNIKQLVPYSSARNEFRGKDAVFLDANENPFNFPFNRYPDPLQVELKKEIAKVKGVNAEQIFLGNGSDEAIDLAFRIFCNPAVDNIITIDPTYDMYRVCARINDISVKQIKLLDKFVLPVNSIIESINSNTKLIFICSPNNPTSNCFSKKDIEQVINAFNGIVVLDEAYIDFAPGKSLLPELKNFPNLIVLQTFSKAWGMAGVRLGMAFASEEIIQLFSKVKYPYNINALTIETALKRIKDVNQKDQWVEKLLNERENLRIALKSLNIVEKVLPSDSNFLMAKFVEPSKIFNYLKEKKIIIRDRSKVALCEGCLRITVGTQSENLLLINALKEYQNNTNE
ncbi:MAG: histidinol-phosphate transaminase [Bacteroidales bacterium]|nr:histidinol-phosphate transaminase [Bacteroidales bacterium]